MSDLSNYRRFEHINDKLQEAKNFQGYIFTDIDLRESKEPISFFRSDFRSTKFSNYYLFKNNFDRADFIDSYFTNGTIEGCEFGSDFLNTLFHKTLFQANNFESCTLSNCSFIESIFKEGVFKEISMKDCEFKQCSFEATKFEMNTIDEIRFVNCYFKDVDFSNMTAVNISFINCSFEEFTIDPDYLGSYFVEGEFFGKASFFYRGHSITLFEKQKELIEGFISIYKGSNRFYELMNLYLILGSWGELLNQEILTIIPGVFKLENALVKEYQLKKILDALKFYVLSSKIDLLVYFPIIYVLEKFINEELDFGSRLMALSQLNSLKILLENEIIERGYKERKLYDRAVVMEMELSTDDIGEAEKLVHNYFKEYLDSVSTNHDSISNIYRIINVRKGSVIIEVLCYAFLVLPLSITLKKTSRNIMDTILEFKFKKAGIKLLDNPEKIKDLEKVKELFFEKNKSSSMVQVKGEKKEDLTKILKSLKIFFNILD